MSYVLGTNSLNNLEGVHPKLVAVVKQAIKLSLQDFSVGEGVRTPERQRELYAQGRTKPGPIVTWVLVSNHFKQADGYGHAVDLITYPLNYNNTAGFLKIRDAMFLAAKQLGITLRWGGDWNRNGIQERGETDIGHYELYPYFT